MGKIRSFSEGITTGSRNLAKSAGNMAKFFDPKTKKKGVEGTDSWVCWMYATKMLKRWEKTSTAKKLKKLSPKMWDMKGKKLWEKAYAHMGDNILTPTKKFPKFKFSELHPRILQGDNYHSAVGWY